MQDLTTINSADRPPPSDDMSECESLPLDERVEFDMEDGSRYVLVVFYVLNWLKRIR